MSMVFIATHTSGKLKVLIATFGMSTCQKSNRLLILSHPFTEKKLRDLEGQIQHPPDGYF
jgi:hypothetical protein